MLNVFKTTEQSMVTGGARQLELTAQLTQDATTLAEKVMSQLNDMQGDDGNDLILESFKDYVVLNDMIAKLGVTNGYDYSWLAAVDETEAIKMLKSQQSKKSRARNNELTYTVYKTYLTGAIAELLIRVGCNITKSTSGATGAKLMELTEETMEMYRNDQVLLAKAIRNIQSKKSIAKKKGIAEDSEEFMDIISYEESLKALRVSGGTAVDPTTKIKAEKADQIEKMLSELDTESMKKGELASAIASIKELMLSEI